MDNLKTFGKQTFTNILVFLFCVIFISFYNSVCGQDNNIIGVVILIGLFMLMKSNLDFNVKQATGSIIGLFLIIAISPKVSLINPFLGLLVNFISIGIIMTISSHDIKNTNYVPFMMGYLFCRGYNVSGYSYSLRFISILISSIIIALIYYSSNKNKTCNNTLHDIFKKFDIHSKCTQWHLKLNILLTLSMFVCDLIGYPRTMWITLTVLSLTIPFKKEQSKRNKARIPATILGTLVYYLAFEMLVPQEYQSMVVLIAGFVAMYITNYFIKSIYNSFSALGTAVLFFPTQEAILIRIVSNIIGVITAIVGNHLFNKMFEHISSNNNETQEICN